MPDAARKLHPHTCPQILHSGGPIVDGSPVILTVGLPATRLVDRAACSGPDPVAQGSSTVLIDGLPASRRGDLTSHGGAIVDGEPSVLIGGAAVTIKVKGDEAFIAAVQTALARLLRTHSGLEWMRQMAKNGRAVTITSTDKKDDWTKADDPKNNKNGVGSDSTIFWNPDHHETDPDAPGLEGTPGSDVCLAHEMVHALHNANGDNRNGPNDVYEPWMDKDKPAHRNEERSTVGTSPPIFKPDGTIDPNAPDYSRDVPTENSFRDDLGIPRRQTYFPTKFPGGGAPW